MAVFNLHNFGITIILVCLSNIALTQINIEASGLSQDSTLIENDIYDADPTKKGEGFFAMFEGAPGRAALYSAIIPGAGQIYNKKWLKAPIVWGLEGTVISFIVFFTNQQNILDTKYKGFVRGELTEWRGYTDASALKQARDKVKKYRDYSYVALGVAHILNIADAFVDRHLIEFDIEEDISLNIGMTQHGVGLTMSIH